MATRTEPTETVMNLTDTKQQFRKVVNQVARGETRIVIEKHGLQAAVLISPEEYSRFISMEKERGYPVSKFAEAAAEFSKGFDDVSEKELESELSRIRKEYRELTDRERPK